MGGWFRINSKTIEEKGTEMGPYGMAVYMVLAMHADNKTGETWPSYQTIAEKTGISRRKVISTIDHLLELGVIGKEARIKDTGDATSNKYTIADMPKGGGAPHAPPSAPHAPGVVHDMHRGSAHGAPELDLEELDPVEPEESAPATTADPFKQFVDVLVHYWGRPPQSENEGEKIADWSERVSLEAWTYAMGECAANAGVGKWRYLEKVLERLEVEGYTPGQEQKKPQRRAGPVDSVAEANWQTLFDNSPHLQGR